MGGGEKLGKILANYKPEIIGINHDVAPRSLSSLVVGVGPCNTLKRRRLLPPQNRQRLHTDGTHASFIRWPLARFPTVMGVKDVLSRKAGVIYGDDVLKLFNYAQEHNFAIPAINVTSSSTVVASLEAARDRKSPIILQLSQGGAAYFSGKVCVIPFSSCRPL